jgi:hypothetical protein
MSAKTRKNSIYVIYEGYLEGYFLEHLEKYGNVRLNPIFCSGGSSNQIVINAIRHSARDVNVYAFFDEDFETKQDQKISGETMEGLAKAWNLNKDVLIGCPYKKLQTLNIGMKNPIIVVSHPQSLEGFLLRLLDSPRKDTLEGKTTKQLKQIIESFLGNIHLNDEDKKKIQLYDKKIDQYRVEISKLKQNEPNYREHLRFLESKIKDCERGKSKVTFMRFLSEKLTLPVILAKRSDIIEIDILLKAFGL